MSKKSTVLGASCDFALAEAVELYAFRHNLPRADAIRQILRQIADPRGECSRVRTSLQWVQVKEGKSLVWMLDGGDGRWAVMRCAPNAYPVLTIEEPGCLEFSRSMYYSPDEYAIYLAEGIILKRWPHLAPKAPMIVKTVGEKSKDAGIGHWTIDLEEALKAA